MRCIAIFLEDMLFTREFYRGLKNVKLICIHCIRIGNRSFVIFSTTLQYGANLGEMFRAIDSYLVLEGRPYKTQGSSLRRPFWI